VARISTALALVLLPILVASQNTSDVPKIRVSSRLVQVNIIVQDTKGGAVENLTKDDFVVLDQGKPREISLFSLESTESAPQPARPLPQNTFSDLPQDSASTPRSITIVLLDNLNTLYGSAPEPYESTPTWFEDLALTNAKGHLIEFIKQLDPQDRVAIYGLSDSLHVLCDFTSDRSQLLTILRRYDTTSMTNRERVEHGSVHMPNQNPLAPGAFSASINPGNRRLEEIGDQGRSGITMAALQSIAAHVANIPGRKNLVWLTTDPSLSGAAMARILSPAQIAAYPVDGRGLLTAKTTLETMQGVEDEDASMLGTFARPQSPEPIGIATMKELADETGGQAFVNTNDLTGGIRKAVEDSAVTYTLGFYLDSGSIDGKFHKLSVRLKPKGLTIRYPKGYFAFEDAPLTKDQNRSRVVMALQSPIESSTIPLQVTVNRVSEPVPDTLSLVGSVDIRAIQLAQNGSGRKGAVSVYFFEQDQTGKVIRESTNTIPLQLTEQQYEAFLRSGMHFTKHLEPKAGITTLRILVEDPATGDVGSLIIPLSEVK
jgi:VWFA-related protein